MIRLKLYLLEIAYRELLEETSMQKELYDVIVVGAGIVGCSTSYHLARSGLKVALVDKGSAAGEASQAAAGMLAPLGDEPPDQEPPLQQLGMAALSYYDGLDEQLKLPTCKRSWTNSSTFSQGLNG